jgi:hypothetical protein
MVPLEKNMVRFVDNFSMGTRGASSAEYFLEAGYAVVFLHRQHSLQPWSRHWQSGHQQGHEGWWLDWLTLRHVGDEDVVDGAHLNRGH